MDKAVKRIALDLRNGMELETIVSRISSARVIYLGETHASYADHLTQLDIIRRLHARNPDIAIGMEQFQQPFQDVLDRYTGGDLDEKGMIRQSEWMERWGYDYRLYRPILSFAREHHIPVIALNVPKEVVDKVSDAGFDGLSREEKAKIPSEIDYSDQGYRERLQGIYEKHPHQNKNGFEGFLQIQLLWDEGMAARAAQYLTSHPQRQLVVLAGSGHLMYGSGIPQRVNRRVDVKGAIVLPAGDFTVDSAVADFLVLGAGETLPEPGRLGVIMEDSADGVRVQDLAEDGVAKKAGVEKDDLIGSVNGEPVRDTVDLKLLLLDAVPGDRVELVVLRKNMILQDEELKLELQLGR